MTITRVAARTLEASQGVPPHNRCRRHAPPKLRSDPTQLLDLESGAAPGCAVPSRVGRLCFHAVVALLELRDGKLPFVIMFVAIDHVSSSPQP